MDKNAPIGIFDSGVGGMTVAREVMRQIPEERIVYFGDTARVPYGSKSQPTILRYTRQIIRFLQTQNVKAIVVACNTASAMALEEVRQELDIPIIGVVKPGALVAVNTTVSGKIGVIGTEATIRSEIYDRFIHAINPNLETIGKPCPLFVPLVEEGLWSDPVTDEIAKRYLTDMVEAGIDTLIMGCTHYPLIRKTIKKTMGDGVKLVNPAYETAVQLRRVLEWKEIMREEHPAEENQSERYQFFVSDSPEKFQTFANSILPFEVQGASQINIEEY